MMISMTIVSSIPLVVPCNEGMRVDRILHMSSMCLPAVLIMYIFMGSCDGRGAVELDAMVPQMTDMWVRLIVSINMNFIVI